MAPHKLRKAVAFIDHQVSDEEEGRVAPRTVASEVGMSYFHSVGESLFSNIFFKYLLIASARGRLPLTQLKVMQKCITLFVFTVIAYLLFGQTLKWNNLVSYALLVLAVLFAFGF